MEKERAESRSKMKGRADKAQGVNWVGEKNDSNKSSVYSNQL